MSSRITNDRRAAAPHPGLIIKHDYLDALGIDVPRLAANIGVSGERLDAMLTGSISIDVDAAVRLSRALQLSAERIMQMQVRYDFSQARSIPGLADVDVASPVHPPTFLEPFALHGHLRQSTYSEVDGSLFFQEDVGQRVAGDAYAGLHALWQGDRLRVYAPDGAVLWVGPILHDLDGHVMLPFVPNAEWCVWFAQGYRADLAVGKDHAAFFARMNGA